MASTPSQNASRRSGNRARQQAPSGPLHPQHLEILRLLGRLKAVRTGDIARAVFPGISLRWCQERLTCLHRQALIWRVKPLVAMDLPLDGPPPPQQLAYGLTELGLRLLRVHGRDDAAALALLHAGPRPSAQDVRTEQFQRLLRASAWASSIIDHARRLPQLQTIRCHVDYPVVVDQGGAVVQRIGAFVELLFMSGTTRAMPAHVPVPWAGDGAISTNAKRRIVRLALETISWDQDDDELRAQGRLYRQQRLATGFEARCGGDVTPIILVPTREMSGEVAMLWRDSWPETPALISDAVTAYDPELGALWGSYHRIADGAPTPLLGTLMTRETWQRLTTGWNPRPTATTGDSA